MKKFLSALLLTALMSGSVLASEVMKVGELEKLNISPEDFNKMLYGIPTAKFSEFRKGAKLSEFRKGSPVADKRETKFYNSLTELLLALNRGEVDEIILPKEVAQYALKNNDALELVAVNHIVPNYLALGFKDDEEGRRLKSLFNNALITMENSGRLSMLKELYINDAGYDEPEPVKPERFDGAEIVKVAVTGDMPPIDFIAADGIPAGFNTAVLAECAKIAKVNLELMNIDTTARAAALVSGRVGIVFWFQTVYDTEVNLDVPEGIILSEPYYRWDELYAIKLKAK